MPISLTQPIRHGGTAFTQRRRLRLAICYAPKGLFIRTYNIHNGWGFELSQAIQVVQVGVFDLMVLTETKVTCQVY